jgi:hypothetical protein
MNICFTEEELNKIMDILADLPIRHINIVQKVQSIIQQKYTEASTEAARATTNPATPAKETNNVTALP